MCRCTPEIRTPYCKNCFISNGLPIVENIPKMPPVVEPPLVRGLTFSKALLGLRAGERLQREGWNGKNMWIALGAGSTALPAEKFWNPHARQFAETNGGSADVDPYFIMKTAQGTIQMGWIPSQADILANDWQTLPDESKPEVIHVFLDPNKDFGEQIAEVIKKIVGEKS